MMRGSTVSLSNDLKAFSDEKQNSMTMFTKN